MSIPAEQADKINRELLECPVCNEQYDEEDRIPLLLPCQHTFCTVCLQKIHKHDKINCPTCRGFLQIKETGIKELPKDNTRRRLMELLKPEKPKCDQCEESLPAVSYCKTCNENMCRECASHHSRQKKTKSHAVETIRNTEQVDSQSASAGTESYSNHNRADIDDFPEKRRLLRELIICLERTGPEAEQKLRQSEGRDVASRAKEFKKTVVAQFAEYKDRMDARLNEMCVEIDNVADRINKTNERLVSECQKTMKMGNDLLTNVSCADAFLKQYEEISHELERYQPDVSPLHEFHIRCTHAWPVQDFEMLVAALGKIEPPARADMEIHHDNRGTSSLAEGEPLSVSHDRTGLIIALQSLLQPGTTKTLSASVELPINNEQIPLAVSEPGDGKEHVEPTNVESAVSSRTRGISKQSSQTVPFVIDTNRLKECIVEKALPKAVLNACDSSEIRETVRKRFKIRCLEGEWKIKEGELFMCSATNLMAEKCVSLLLDSVQRTRLLLRKECVNVVNSDKWQGLHGEIAELFREQVWTTVLGDCSEIIVCATCPSILADVRDMLQKFLHDNLVHKFELRYPEELGDEIMKQTVTLRSIQTSYSHFGVYVSKSENGGIEVQGTGYGVAASVKRVQEIAAQLSGEKDRFEADTNEERFLDPDNPNPADSIQSHPAHLIPRPKIALLAENKGLHINAICFPGDDCVIYVVTGDITALPVEAVVNPADPTLKHNGGLAQILCRKGGGQIQAESSYRVQSEGQLTPGQVFCSGAGTLPFRAIIHAVSSKWSSGQEAATTDLANAVNNVLHSAAARMISTLAIPAIGAGAYKVPVEVSANTIVETIKVFGDKNPRSGVRELYLCDIDSQTTKQFVLALKKHYAEKDIVTGQEEEKATPQVLYRRAIPGFLISAM